ncbi:SGNH/GDSL hydrolase family protein [Maribacter aestuarii]|uniref:SGNH/GDSL hydrolase family protein n=1 Tax=Maribacter aestuarii TaxID=1130723 RepID=UPI00248B109A|nr:GDSL-type esterase/lipase family protein [Maribacter aestuarii]
MKKIGLFLSIFLNLFLIGYIFFNSNSEKKTITEIKEVNGEVIYDEKGLVVEPVNIVMLGNSITFAGDWQDELKRKDVFNGGKPGWTTQQLSWVIKNFIVPYKPRVCFFKGGINDYSLGIGTDRIYENMTVIMDSINVVGTKPVYTTTLYQRGVEERNREIDLLNARMQKFCSERGYDFMDLRPFLCKEGDILDAYVQDDNTHLKPEAYPRWAEAMKPILKKYGL